MRTGLQQIAALALSLVVALPGTASLHARAADVTEIARRPLVVHVDGNHLVNRNGAVVELAGLNRSGSEYACAQGWGIFDGPVDDTSIAAMTTWRPQIVRVPLNEDCWLGINGVDPQYGGAAYREAVAGFVARLERHG